jgi:hypothetical protein
MSFVSSVVINLALEDGHTVIVFRTGHGCSWILRPPERHPQLAKIPGLNNEGLYQS